MFVLQESTLFDKEDWIKISYTYSDGMKVYYADMFCPVCLGKLTPQNRKKAGRVPQWELNNIKRHLMLVYIQARNLEKVIQ